MTLTSEKIMNIKKVKKTILSWLPFVIFGYAGDLISLAYRTAEGNGISEKMMPFMNNLGVVFAQVIPSFNVIDLGFGVAVALIMKLIMYIKSKNKKKFRNGEEYGSARWSA